MLEPKSPRRPFGIPAPIREEPVADVARLRIALVEVIPPVWRRIRVPVHVTFRRLHPILQCAMGWPESEEHQFRIGDIAYGKPEETDATLRDSRWVRLADVIGLGRNSFVYAIGPESLWEHEVRIETVLSGNPDNQRPMCLEGERACPPEGCPGPEAYVEHAARRRESSRRARAGAEKARPAFDPDTFDLDSINRRLSWQR